VSKAAKEEKLSYAFLCAEESVMYNLEYLAKNGTLRLSKYDGCLVWTDLRQRNPFLAYSKAYFSMFSLEKSKS